MSSSADQLLSPSQIKKEPVIDFDCWTESGTSLKLTLDLERRAPDFDMALSRSMCLGLLTRLDCDVHIESHRGLDWLDLATPLPQ